MSYLPTLSFKLYYTHPSLEIQGPSNFSLRFCPVRAFSRTYIYLTQTVQNFIPSEKAVGTQVLRLFRVPGSGNRDAFQHVSSNFSKHPPVKAL
jgi:hypothetical protein